MSDLLEIKNLVTRFYTSEGVVTAVNGISYSIQAGETVAIVGESGSGKSVSMLSVMRLIAQPPGRIESGEILFEGRDLLKLSKDEMRKVNGSKIAMIFQDPMTSMNPVLTVGFQLMEPLRFHQGMDSKAAENRAVQLLEMVGVPSARERLNNYPHQFSGGMRQRVMIAMALACNPSLLIADEPTTALDVTVQAQITRLVDNLKKELGMTVIWITHDLGVVARITKRVIVMYAGTIVEDAPVKEFYANPRHPYSAGLLNSLPKLNALPGQKLLSIKGQPPDLIRLPQGCPFAARCKYTDQRCKEEKPPEIYVSSTHRVRCWKPDLDLEVKHELANPG